MYHQTNPTELFRERQLALLRESETWRLSRQLRIRRTPMAGSTIPALGYFLAALVVAALMALVAEPAQAAWHGANGEIVFASSRTTGAGVDNPTGDLEIFKMNPDGTGLVQLTRNTASDSDPAFSPDGKKIVFSSARDEVGGEIYTMNADGSSPANFTQFQGAIDGQPDWGATCTINGTAGNDTLVGTAGDDFICALSGKDMITGGSGDDVIIGGPGRDRLFGEAGNDLLDSRDRVKRNDRLNGGDGTDVCTIDRRDKKVGCP